MIKVFWMIALLVLSPGTDSGWDVEIRADQSKIHIDEQVIVTIECQFPEGYEPDLQLFLKEVKNVAEFGYFSFVNAETKREKNELQIQLVLEPLKFGTLTFIPPPLHFSANVAKKTLFIPVLKVECIRKEAATFHPLLSTHPEQDIMLSPANQALQEREFFGFERLRWHELAWTILACGVLLLSMVFIISWCLIEFQLFQKRKPTIIPKPNFEKLTLALEHSEEPLTIRFQQLASLLHQLLSEIEGKPLQGKISSELITIVSESQVIQHEQKSSLESFLSRLDSIEFSPFGATEQDWEQAVDEVHKLVALTKS